MIKKWFQNKLNLALSISLGVFLVSAALTYVWGEVAALAMVAMVAIVVLLGMKVQVRHKQLKKRYNQKMEVGELTEAEAKRARLGLKQLVVQYVLFYIFAASILLLVGNQVVQMFIPK